MMVVVVLSAVFIFVELFLISSLRLGFSHNDEAIIDQLLDLLSFEVSGLGLLI